MENILPHAVKEKLTADPDSEIATTSLRVSLLCPVSTTTSELLMITLPSLPLAVFINCLGSKPQIEFY